MTSPLERALPIWQIKTPSVVGEMNGEPPLVIQIAAEDWGQAKEAWADMLEKIGVDAALSEGG